MDLASQIYTRKSCRNYFDDEIDMGPIHDFISKAKPLDENVSYSYEIVTRDKVNARTRWSAPYYLILNCEKNEICLGNIGFVFQQVSLYLQSVGIGSCWVGMASPKNKSPDFTITIAFGKSDRMTRDSSQFKRNKLSKICDVEDEALIPAQLAPSAINSQPWFFRHSDNGFDMYKVKQNIVKRQILKNWNSIDVGIALAHLYVANKDSFRFEIKNDAPDLKGYTYVGSIEL